MGDTENSQLDKTQLENQLLLAEKEKLEAERRKIDAETENLTKSKKSNKCITYIEKLEPIIKFSFISVGAIATTYYGITTGIIDIEKRNIEAQKSEIRAEKEVFSLRKMKDSLDNSIKISLYENVTDKNKVKLIFDLLSKMNQRNQDSTITALKHITKGLVADTLTSSLTNIGDNSNNITTTEQAISGLFDKDNKEIGKAYSKLINSQDDNDKTIPELIKYAYTQQINDKGIYNTLVVLSHFDYEKYGISSSTKSEIRKFADSMKIKKKNEPTILLRVDKLIRRLP